MKNSLPLLPTDGPLDPTLFAIDWTMLTEGLALIVVLSFFVERALALLFESRLFLNYEIGRARGGKGSHQSLIAFVVSALVCYVWQFDIISILFHRERMTILGAILTGAVIAGGSKASIKLFHDVLNVKSSYYEEVKGGKAKHAHKAPPKDNHNEIPSEQHRGPDWRVPEDPT